MLLLVGGLLVLAAKLPVLAVGLLVLVDKLLAPAAEILAFRVTETLNIVKIQ